jgi:hypothetical protein
VVQKIKKVAKKTSENFWANGFSLAETITILLVITTIGTYIWLKRVDTNFADIVIGSVIVSTCGRVAPEIFSGKSSRGMGAIQEIIDEKEE